MTLADNTRIWIVAGSLGSMALGIALIPLRQFTSASNLAFAFLAFTIIVAEFGGRTAALVTAVMSAISLNFFLTEPYLTLAISKPDDLVAFFALAACGLIAAAFGRRREHWSEVAGRAGDELEVLRKLVGRLDDGTPLDEIMGDLKRSFGLSAIVLRDEDERILAAAPIGWTPTQLPRTRVAADTLLPSDDSRLRFGARGLRLPEGGGRFTVRSEGGVVSLDVWEGDARGFGLLEGRTLAIAASILGRERLRRRAG
jgi:K+-sensing histidine kinase KdpD